MEPRQTFEDFLRQHAPERAAELMVRFSAFHRLLSEINREINLISRKMPPEEYWTTHYLDSLLPATRIDFNEKRVLDFGTGGGLPGIPLAFWAPTSGVTLLDSKIKKINVLKNILNSLDLQNCLPFASRLEEFPRRSGRNQFDYIVCRSVRYEPVFGPHFARLLAPTGRVIFYKAHDETDLDGLPEPERLDLSHPAVGRRIIVIHRRKDFEIVQNS
jgi:16S rRNA (guanine527-N7)-methyltransferase